MIKHPLPVERRLREQRVVIVLSLLGSAATIVVWVLGQLGILKWWWL